jgi:large subunit ribosomal protein L10
MALAPKKAFVADMQAEVDKAAGVLFVDFFKLTVAQANTLRASLRAGNVRYRVVKNTLMTRVLAGKPFESASQCLKGTPTGVVWSHEDPVTPAKLAYAFAKECNNFKVKGGIVDNQSISPAQAEALSELPSREELQGQIVTLAKSPGSKVAGQIKSPAGRIVGAVEALCEKLEGQAS